MGKEHYGYKIISKDELAGKNCNLILAFHTWNTVVDSQILKDYRGKIFADYPYFKTSVAKCILCGATECEESKAHFSPFLQERQFKGKAPETKIVRCKKCGAAFSKYRPSDEEMDNLYRDYRGEEYYQVRHKHEPQYDRKWNDKMINPDVIERRRILLWGFIKDYVQNAKSILDYGGDKGQIIPTEFPSAQKAVFDVSGNKVLPGIDLITDLEEIGTEQWDFVMCLHLLEHVSDPVNIVSNIVHATSADGYIYLEVPYEHDYEQYSEYQFSEHINFYTRETMKHLGERFGLRIIRNEVVDGNKICVLLKNAKSLT